MSLENLRHYTIFDKLLCPELSTVFTNATLAIMQVLAVVVCLFVRLSICHKSVFY